MTAYRAPNFNERATLSRQAKQKALDQFRAKPQPSEEERIARAAAGLRREQAEAERRAAKLQSEAEARAAAAEAKTAAADARAAADEVAARAAEAAIVPVKSEAEKKADRDARYAARKNRKK